MSNEEIERLVTEAGALVARAVEAVEAESLDNPFKKAWLQGRLAQVGLMQLSVAREAHARLRDAV